MHTFFLDALETGKGDLSGPLASAVEALKIVLASHISIRERRIVRLAEMAGPAPAARGPARP